MMQVVRSLLVAAVLLAPTVLTTPAVLAEDAASSALAGDVVTLSVIPGIDARLAHMIDDAVSKQPADKQAEVRSTLGAVATPVRAELLKIFTAYYAKDFSAAELQQLKAFYESPLGKKVVDADVRKPADVNSKIEQQFMKIVAVLKTLPGK